MSENYKLETEREKSYIFHKSSILELIIVGSCSLDLIKKAYEVQRDRFEHYLDEIIIIAYRKGRFDILDYLLEKGGDINTQDGILLRSACSKLNFEKIQFLVERKADVNIQDGICLQYLCAESYYWSAIKSKILLYLLENGANAKTKSRYLISYNTDKHFSKILINKGFDVNTDNFSIIESFVENVKKNDEYIDKIYDNMVYLIERGADDRLRNCKFLSFCVINKKTKIVEYLLEKIEYSSEDLTYAAFDGLKNNISKYTNLLIEKGAKIEHLKYFRIDL